MFKFLRSKAKLFYWVIAATFILFLFLGGLTGRGCQAPGSGGGMQAGVIGSVNGTPISAQNYDYAYRQMLAQFRQQSPNRDLNANQVAVARERAWDTLVQSTLVDQAIAHYKIKVSDQEVLEAFQNNPPPELLAAYRDENGQVDLNRYFADLQNPENDWSRAEQYVRALLPRQKLEQQIARDAVVTDEEVRAEYLRQTGRAVAEYAGAFYADLPEQPEPDEATLRAWYDAHGEDFQRPAMGLAKVVRFAKQASEDDYAEVLSFAREIREEILSGRKDFAAAATEYSEDGSAAQGGDLGVFDRNRMAAPFTEVAFSQPVGEVSEPVRTKFGWHLIEVLERDVDQKTGEVYQVRARHILLKVAPGLATLDLLRESAEDFLARVKADNFVQTAEAEALDLVQPQPFAAERDIPGVALSLAGTQFVFGSPADRVSPVLENRDFYYVVLAEGVQPAGLADLEEVRGQVALAVRQDANLKAARALLGPVAGEVQMGRTLAVAAAGAGLSYAVTDTFTMNGNIEKVGYGTDFNRVAIEGKVGQLVPEVETLRGLFALVPLWIQPVDEADFAARRQGLQAALLNRKQAEIIDQWFTDRQAEADIVDHRYEFGQAF